ncbi:hypothetical protein AAV35_012795 [Salimicrobium jeotgali]|uniref:YopX protein domain-containing protein n=1 Tax=Salimicrobium jeotgali TaxID=1230341 RepID=K2G7S6_9BACI|nr:YopX family protein [Salimicrobium jeotgali]AKG05540.1 hypothetical protein AAV35_012795 [Salimicrobium jeotgali]EKE30467.1 hypothetical protein MJ3_13539 [Salimicrobium jeotgali]MBM7696613.1 putative phage protein (TIGR01671 family) [Salimicrobium jeotgali]
MREIKFRAWDDVEGEMLYCGEDTDIVFTLEDRGQGLSCTDIRHGDPQLDIHLPHMEHLKYMQFTGLYDKNGWNIYEGDILSTDLSRPYLIVEFRNGAFMYQCHDNGKDYYDLMVPPSFEGTTDEYAEVIGNIYEHSELIGG